MAAAKEGYLTLFLKSKLKLKATTRNMNIIAEIVEKFAERDAKEKS